MTRGRPRADGTGYRSSKEEAFALAWEEHSPFGDRGKPHHDYRLPGDSGYLFDFAWPGIKIAVEIQGHTAGHRSIQGAVRDAAKGRYALERGWIVIYFTSSCLSSKAKREDAVHFVCDIIRRRQDGLFGPVLITPKPQGVSANGES